MCRYVSDGPACRCTWKMLRVRLMSPAPSVMRACIPSSSSLILQKDINSPANVTTDSPECDRKFIASKDAIVGF